MDNAPCTTSGSIAIANLQAQIDSFGHAATARPDPIQRIQLADLLALRGHMLGCIADYERASAITETLVHEMPRHGAALAARSRARATLHLFTEALTDLDAADRLGADDTTVARAAIFQALGRYREAAELLRAATARHYDFAVAGALACLYAEREQIGEAGILFAEAGRLYRDVSPFPIAMLDFRHGLMWFEHGDTEAARSWFEAARRRLPDYVPVLGHLAELDASRGEFCDAIARLRPLAARSDDPEYAGLLAAYLDAADHPTEAVQWRARAATRYDALTSRHPEAFADHAAEFWLGAGADARKALHLAERNLENRRTPRARALVRRAERALGIR